MLSLVVLSFMLFSTQVLAFHFSFNTPSECDDIGLTWTGGTPPFKLHIIPVYGTPREVSIPISAFSNGKGSHSVQLPFRKSVQVLFTMSDSTGFNAGGSSNVYTVLQSNGGVCNSTDPGTAFVFQLNSNLQQCRPFTFSGFDGAVPPVTIGVVIPGGTALTMNPPPGQSSYEWTVNVARRTSMIFFMTDSQGRQGGSSDLRSVGASDDSSCLDNSSPSTTTDAPTPTQTSALPSSSIATSAPVPLSAASIAGAIIGSVLFLAVTITLALFFLKRTPSKESKTPIPPRVDLTDGGTHEPSFGYPTNHRMDSGSYPGHFSSSDFKYPASEASFSDPTSPALYPPQPHHSYSHQSQYNIPAAPSLQESDKFGTYMTRWASGQQSSTLTMQPRATSEGIPSQLPYSFHAGAEDPSPYDGGFVESPPQYFERQGLGEFSTGYTYDTKHPL